MICKINRKGSFIQDNFIAVGISLIILLMMIYFSTDLLLEDNYSKDVMECNFFVSNIDGKPKYFSNGLDTITFNLIDSISEICPSKEVEILKNKFSDSAKLVKGCNDIIGGGSDFLGANFEGKSVCVHCGFINVEEDISNFNEKFSKVLHDGRYNSLFNNDSELINTNSAFLSEDLLPENLGEGDNLRVLAYVYKPEAYVDSKFTDSLKQKALTKTSIMFGNFASSRLNYFLADSLVDGYYGVVVEKFEEYDEFNLDREVNFVNKGSSLGCDKIIVPKKNYN